MMTFNLFAVFIICLAWGYKQTENEYEDFS